MKTRIQHIADIKKRFDSYVNGVESGKIVTGNLIKLAVKRFSDDLANNKDYYFDLDEAANIIYGIESLFCFCKGKWVGSPVRMEPWQIFTEAQKFGWFEDEGLYRYLRSYEEVAKKNGKSPRMAWSSLMHIIMSFRGSLVLIGSTKVDQSRIITDYAGKTVQESPQLKNSLFDLYHFRDEISRVVYKEKNSSIRTLTSQAKKDQGLIPTRGIVDEYWAADDDSVYNGVGSGLINNDNAVLEVITTAGYNREGPCYQLRKMAKDVLSGTIEDDRFLALIHTIDDDDDWKDEEVRVKANPNYGVSVMKAGLDQRFKEAVTMGGTKEIDYKTLHLNVWTDAASVWIPSEKFALCDKGPITINQRKAFGGVQLAATRGINCFCLCMPNDNGGEDYKFWFWLPKDVVNEDDELKDSYLRWAKDGWLTLTDGNVIDYGFIISKIKEVRGLVDLKDIRFAPQYESSLMPLLDEGFILNKCANNYQNMTETIKKFESRVEQQAINHEGNPVLAWMMGNVALKHGPDKTVRIDKEASQNNVSGPVAMLMALKGMLEYKMEPSPGVY